MFGADGRATLTFPSPYLRNAPTMLAVERGAADDVASWRREEVTSYESGFKAELVAFHAAVTGGAPVPTNGRGRGPGHRDVPGDHPQRGQRAPVERPPGLLAGVGQSRRHGVEGSRRWT